jgi:hypothetical protein
MVKRFIAVLLVGLVTGLSFALVSGTVTQPAGVTLLVADEPKPGGGG